MKQLAKHKLSVGLGAAILILIVIGFVSFVIVNRYREDTSKVARTQQVLQELEILLSSLVDAETGQQGYLLTGEESYLEPYQRSIGVVAQQLRDLRLLVIDKVVQQKLNELEPLIIARLAISKETIELRQQNKPEAALAIVRSNRGKQVMDQIRLRIESIKEGERALLRERSEQADSSAATALFTLGGLVALDTALFGLIYYLFRRDLSSRQKALMLLTEKAKLQQQLRDGQRNSDLKRKTALSGVALAVNSPAQLNEVLQVAVRQLYEELAGISASIGILRPDSTLRYADIVAATNFSEEIQVEGLLLDLQDLPHSRQVLQTQLPVYFTLKDTSEVERFYFEHSGFYSTLIIPLVIADKPIGIAYVNYGVEGQVLDEAEMSFARDLATQCALAINKANLLTERQRLLEEVQRRAEQLEERVLERTHQLEEANRHKSQFLSQMSHELRTPLNSILGFTSILLQEMAGPLNSEQSKQLSLVQGSAYQLLALISGLLDLARIEAGKVTLKISEFDLNQTLQVATESVRPLAEGKGLTLALENQAGSSGLSLRSDETKFKQVLLNLLSNAIKFTDTGHVTICARRLETLPGTAISNRQKGVQIEVKDTGIGISPAQLPRLFQEFGQLEEAGSRRHGGSGLGLVLTRRLVQLLGGQIEVESTKGVGSTFSFWLPLSPTMPGLLKEADSK